MKNSANQFFPPLPVVMVQYVAPSGKIDVDQVDHEHLCRSIINDDAFLQQQLYAIFAGANNEMLCHRLISSGDVSAVMVNLKLLLAIAIQVQCAKIILCHTRPHFTEAVEFGPVDQFLQKLSPLTSLLNISVAGYYVLGQYNCINAFEALQIERVTPYPCVLE